MFWLWRVRLLCFWFRTLIFRSIQRLRIFLSIDDVIGFDFAHLSILFPRALSTPIFVFISSLRSDDGVQLGGASQALCDSAKQILSVLLLFTPFLLLLLKTYWSNSRS